MAMHEAIETLNKLQTNAAVLQELKGKGRHNENNLHLTNKYLARAGIDLNLLQNRVIHVTGTKGKGSTCAICESILRHHGYKTGFFSSPHLTCVAERIRINGQPLELVRFAEYFWSTYNVLINNKHEEKDMPSYFKFLTIMAFDVFIKEKVDVAIVEVGIGGEYDCTNVLKNTPVTAITSLGLDHTSLLGNTLTSIAWQKTGIMKPGSVFFSNSNYPEDVMQVIKDRAKEKQAKLYFIPELNKYNMNGLKWESLGLIQQLNASMAIQTSHAFMKIKQNSNNYNYKFGEPFQLPNETVSGIMNINWYGRFQIIRKNNVNYYLDGAHTVESMKHCVGWFQSLVKPNVKKILLFNMTGNREPENLIELLLPCQFDEVYFCPNIVYSNFNDLPEDLKELKIFKETHYLINKQQQNAWINLNGSGQTRIINSVDEFFSLMKDYENNANCEVLITAL